MFLLILSFMSITAFSQVTTSGISGCVKDEAGEPLPGAAVIAIHEPSGSQYSTIANVNGRYFINGMRTGGPYVITVSFIGMTDVKLHDIKLSLGETFEQDIIMKSSNELEAVTVVSKKSFKSGMTGTGSSFGAKMVQGVPTVDRSVYDVVKFNPQATVNKNGSISFSGSNNRYNSFQVDGAVANDTFGLAASGTNGGLSGANPISLDAIEEIQVVIAPFDVRNGGFTGGSINAITKSGTNEFKGTAYTYFNNRDMIGKTPGKLTDGQKRKKYDEQTTWTHGFTFGAPIIKNKLFIFTSAEYYSKKYPNIYTPANGSYDNNPLREDIVFGGKNYGKIFTPEIGEMMVKHYEETYLAGKSYGEGISEYLRNDRSINALARIDWNINDANKLMFRYQLADSYADHYYSSPNAYFFNKSGYKPSNKTNTFVAELNSKISDTMQNMFRATAVFVRDVRDVPYKGANIFIREDKYNVTIGTDFSAGANSMDSDNYTITDNFSIFKGNHSITIGTHNEFYKFKNLFMQGAYGSYGFGSINEFMNNKPNSFMYTFSDPELTGGNPRWAATMQAMQFGLYAQDEWRPMHNLTVTYGIRADLPVVTNKPTRNDEFNKTSFATENNQYVGEVPNASLLLSPRIGFRYYMDKEHTAILRGGAGLFTGRVPFVWLSNAFNNNGMESKSISIRGNKIPADFPLTSDPYNDILMTGIAKKGGQPMINTLSRHFKYPQVFRVNLGFDKTFEHGWKITLDALYSKTLNNILFKNLAINSDNKVYAVSKDMANNDNVAPYYNIEKSAYKAIVALGNTNRGYNYSFSAQVEKHFNFGLDLMTSYTFGHSYSVCDGSSSIAYSNWKKNSSIDSNHPKLAHSVFDRPHKVMVVASYTSPMYFGMSTTAYLSYSGISGQRYSYVVREGRKGRTKLDFNGDGQQGNSLLYIPTEKELAAMKFVSEESRAQYGEFISNDSYLKHHRGSFSERYAGIAKFESHFDLHMEQNIFYDVKHGRKVQILFDLLNFSNLLNSKWGIYNNGVMDRTILNVTDMTPDADGNMTPTYKFAPQSIMLNDLASRWRCQLGVRITF